MKTIYFVILFVVLLTGSHCFESKIMLPKPDGGVNAEYEYEQVPTKGPSEVEMDDERDREFDDELFEDNIVPRKPTSAQVAVMESQKAALMDLAHNHRIDLTKVSIPVNPYIPIPNKLSWKPHLKCCPRHWKYGCLHVNQRMPCFRNYYNYRHETCCPFYPYIRMARCSCDKCHVQTAQCIYAGRCSKRYRRTSFVAYCFSRYSWSLRFFNKWIPSSCYCRVGRTSHYPYEATNEKSCQ